MPTRLGKRVTYAHTHTHTHTHTRAQAQAQEQAAACNLGLRTVFANCLSAGSQTEALLGLLLLFGLWVNSVAAFGVRTKLLSILPT